MAKSPNLNFLDERIYRELLRQIMSGEAPRGTKLPTERELAARFGASKTVVRQALTRLRNDRLVYSRQGVGYFVADAEPSPTAGSDPGAVFAFSDIYEMRALLDGHAAACVAREAEPEIIGKLEDLVDAAFAQLKAKPWDLVEARRVDLEFHSTISEACPNALMKPMRDVTSFGVGAFWFPVARLDKNEQIGMTRAAVEEHALILGAIKAGEPLAAETAMRDHFTGSLERYRQKFGDVDPD